MGKILGDGAPLRVPMRTTLFITHDAEIG